MSLPINQASPELLIAIDELRSQMPRLTAELIREVGAPPNGLHRLRDTVARFVGVCDFRPVASEEMILGLVTMFDAGIVQSFAANLDALLKRFAVTGWDRALAMDLATEIELYLSDRITQYGNSDPLALKDNPTREERQFVAAVHREASDAVQTLTTATRLQYQLDNVNQIVEDVKQAAGVVAEGELAKAFSAYGDEEKAQANTFRFGAMGVLIAIMIFSAYTALNLPTSLGSSLAHVGIGLSGLASFGYLAREASHHRKAARWAAVMAVQLRTLDAYSADMTVEQRQDLRAQFSRRVFAEPVYPLDSQADLNGDVTPTLQAVMDLVKVARGS